MYVLILGIDPVQAYWWQEGVAIIAAERYATDPAGLEKVEAHVVNPLRMKNHPNMIAAPTREEDGTGNVWSFGAFLAHLAKQGVDIAELKISLRRSPPDWSGSRPTTASLIINGARALGMHGPRNCSV